MSDSTTINMLAVYIAGPVNSTDGGGECEQFLNVHRMVDVADDLAQLGILAVVPALNSFWHMIAPLPRDYWIAMSRNTIERCDAVFRMAGKSTGADGDVAHASSCGVPVFSDLGRLAAWARERNGFAAEAVEHGIPDYEDERERERARATGAFCPLPESPGRVGHGKTVHAPINVAQLVAYNAIAPDGSPQISGVMVGGEVELVSGKLSARIGPPVEGYVQVENAWEAEREAERETDLAIDRSLRREASLQASAEVERGWTDSGCVECQGDGCRTCCAGCRASCGACVIHG